MQDAVTPNHPVHSMSNLSGRRPTRPGTAGAGGRGHEFVPPAGVAEPRRYCVLQWCRSRAVERAPRRDRPYDGVSVPSALQEIIRDGAGWGTCGVAAPSPISAAPDRSSGSLCGRRRSTVDPEQRSDGGTVPNIERTLRQHIADIYRQRRKLLASSLVIALIGAQVTTNTTSISAPKASEVA